MEKSFEPKAPQPPQEDFSIDIDFDEEPHPKGDPAMRDAKVDLQGKGLSRVETKTSLEFRGAMTGVKPGENPYDLVAEAFFNDPKNQFLKMAFDKDPEAKRRFKNGLATLVETSSQKYQLGANDLMGDSRFQLDILRYSMEFEDEEKQRRMSGRKAA